MFKNAISKLKTALKLVGLAAFILLIAVKAPQIHGDYIRNKVGSQVVMLLGINEFGQPLGGGTGFAVKGKSGETYTLTNGHVCGLANKSGIIYAQAEGKRVIPLKVIDVYEKADLCLVSKFPGAKGLSLANSVSIGEELGLVGHPMLLPITLTKGQLLGYGNVAVLVDMGPCPKDIGMFKTVMSPYGPVCVEIARSGFTNIPSMGGSSGSPVVNILGNIVGVLYAGDSDIHWGILVTLEQVRDFLSSY